VLKRDERKRHHYGEVFKAEADVHVDDIRIARCMANRLSMFSTRILLTVLIGTPFASFPTLSPTLRLSSSRAVITSAIGRALATSSMHSVIRATRLALRPCRARSLDCARQARCRRITPSYAPEKKVPGTVSRQTSNSAAPVHSTS
jgi:hypothetical protein